MTYERVCRCEVEYHQQICSDYIYKGREIALQDFAYDEEEEPPEYHIRSQSVYSPVKNI